MPLYGYGLTAIKPLAAMALLVHLVGCAGLQNNAQPDDPAYAPVMPSALEPTQALNGAIYQPYQHVSLFEDRKARRVGDILTVTLLEATTATVESETEITKESDVSIPTPTILNETYDLNSTLSTDKEFTGEADSEQQNSLRGTISVTVTHVYPNGVLAVRGEKWMQFNRGDEYIRLSGLVRPEDIGPDNTVPSTKVADARIAYSQKGELADANKVGFLTRFFLSTLWPL